MIKKIFVLILILFILTSCSFGLFGVATTNSIFKNEDNVKIGKYKFQTESQALSIGISRLYYKDIKNKNDYNKNADGYKRDIDNINISLNTFNGDKLKLLSVNLLPIIPAIPIIPAFFFPAMNHKNFCGGKNLKVLLNFSSDYDILNNISVDLKNIYLLNNNQKIYATNISNDKKIHFNNFNKKNYYTNLYTIDFPINCKDSNNSLIFIENLKINNKNINMPAGKILYQSSFVFAIGYMTNS